MPLIPKLLGIKVVSVSVASHWPSDGSAYAATPFRWNVTLNVTPQPISSPNSLPAPYFYDGRNVVVGDWISNAVGGLAWIIHSISSQSSSVVNCVVEDVAQYNTYADSSTDGNGAPPNLINGFLFSLNESGQPILASLTPNVLTSQWQSDVMGRFAATTPPVTTAVANFPIGGTLSPSAYVLTMLSGALTWIPLAVFGTSSSTSSSTAYFELEDGSGALLLEDGSGFLTQES